MCDFSTFEGLIWGAHAAVIVAVVAIGIAAALNAGFFSAAGSPAAMIAAAVASLAAAGLLYAARGVLESYFQCMVAAHPDVVRCSGAYSNLMTNIAALATVLTIQATACGVVAGVAWIPWGPQPAMWVILGTLVLQLPLIVSLIAFFVDFKNCLDQALATGRMSSPLRAAIVVGLVAVAATYGLVYASRRRLKQG